MDLSTEEKVALHTKKFVLWKTCFSPHQSAYGADYVITKAITNQNVNFAVHLNLKPLHSFPAGWLASRLKARNIHSLKDMIMYPCYFLVSYLLQNF
jgi:hypothetical protein